MLSGHDLLATIERMLDGTRRERAKLDVELERSTQELARVRQAELGVLSVLARLRLREIESGELVEALDETGRQVTELLGQRAGAQAEVETEVKAAEAQLADVQKERAERSAAVDAAEKALDAAEAEAQKGLADDDEYRAQLEKARASDGVADLAEEKAQAARNDRVEKGKPYEADPLFTYLWARGFGTSQYRAGAFARLLDRWVARVCDYEPLRRDYWMLSELPARFDEHSTRMRALADEDVTAVQALEHKAAEAAGVPKRAIALEQSQKELAEADKTIEERDAGLDALVDKRASFASGEDDLSRRCTALLSDTFRREKMKTLRERANRTATADDDKAVDELTAVRAEIPRLEDEATRYKALHETHRDRTTKLEEIRKRFKENRFDAVSSEFVNSALITTLLAQLLAGSLGVPDIWDAIAKQQRFRKLAADPLFGSGRFPRAPGPWHMPGGFPKGGGWGKGGFGKGGFGGGGFRTGGGFGGGGFRTRGGF
jgi:chromosome segregation ATPase